ncbi:MAG TPA: hypothetical protein VHG28_14100, partial [Longimicrobiaceae bacterium]|nr:hypothetical protein [Longimicrobiaceae bacterium]
MRMEAAGGGIRGPRTKPKTPSTFQARLDDRMPRIVLNFRDAMFSLTAGNTFRIDHTSLFQAL